MNTQNLIDTIVANLPLLITVLGAVGALSFVAGHIRRGVVEAQKAAAKTPSKIDDFLVDLVDGPLLEAAKMIECGRPERRTEEGPRGPRARGEGEAVPQDREEVTP